ncbi:hypothetical protein [Mesoflavibacter profundi]|uniref:hypothetical protein n=1 Tax=Mesoflavibacter profundi TaxID=2708110 RepID=UPI003517B456
MEDSYYFDRFCNILSDEVILKTSTAYGVSRTLKTLLKEIQSQVLKTLYSLDDGKNDYLDYLINEVEKQDYVKEVYFEHIQRWLDEYNTTLEELEELDHRKPIARVLDAHYNDMEPFSPEKDKAFLLQSDFLNYYCLKYANKLIAFLNSKKQIQKQSTMSQTNPKPFKDEYLTVFCKENQDDREIKNTSFMQLYDYGITHYRPYLESEITENLLMLDSDKIEHYLDFVIDKVKKTNYADIPDNFIDKWITKYDVDINDFPKFKNKELNDLLNMCYSGYWREPELQEEILDIQIDFFCYACMLEVKKIEKFIMSKKSNNSNLTKEDSEDSKLKWIGKPSQLGFIISSLVDLGYIEAPVRQNGDINYTQFAKLVKQTFDIDTTESTLSKYLNTDSEKGQEPMRKFEEYGFNIPHKNIVS